MTTMTEVLIAAAPAAAYLLILHRMRVDSAVAVERRRQDELGALRAAIDRLDRPRGGGRGSER
ncbi:hypothetical protein LG943_04430 [Streptomonospora sp. S1-112]|uniref:Uncharacterized protein n=1 Tax=Streptomonospora mangrovi TaxID=2883123 RepID=A0A9X3NK70_9ACTN|nr:hypothetical protein [Streptomonospora mangrovi]MDA0563581.1 hypothetical protein [Streptomonospora mangrovi]